MKDCKTSAGSNTALILAVRRDDLPQVEALLKQGREDINHQGEFKWTALYNAVRQCNIEITRLLLAHGANPFIGGHQELNPIELACQISDDIQKNKFVTMLTTAAFHSIGLTASERSNLREFSRGFRWKKGNHDILTITYRWDLPMIGKDTPLARKMEVLSNWPLGGATLNAGQQTMIKQAFLAFEEMIPVMFVEAGSDEPAQLIIRQITRPFGFSANVNIFRLIDHQGYITQSCIDLLDDTGLVNPHHPFNRKITDTRCLHKDQFLKTLIHTIGHALGMEHPKSYGVNQTVMSYDLRPLQPFETSDGVDRILTYPSTLMPYDIRALQSLYGEAKHLTHVVPITRGGKLYTLPQTGVETIYAGHIDTPSEINLDEMTQLERPSHIASNRFYIVPGTTIKRIITGRGNTTIESNMKGGNTIDTRRNVGKVRIHLNGVGNRINLHAGKIEERKGKAQLSVSPTPGIDFVRGFTFGQDKLTMEAAHDEAMNATLIVMKNIYPHLPPALLVMITSNQLANKSKFILLEGISAQTVEKALEDGTLNQSLIFSRCSMEQDLELGKNSVDAYLKQEQQIFNDEFPPISKYNKAAYVIANHWRSYVGNRSPHREANSRNCH
ncbi:MAG: ankyrin repeat domain-containing protein [Alphaproteobacteria bacterium]|nr:ankyrin repeat domain-containing protein [Alphaproteobacteria bacterium]